MNEAHFTYFREAAGRLPASAAHSDIHDVCATVARTHCFNDPTNPDFGIHPGLGAGHEGVPFVDVSGLFSYGNNFEGEIPQIGNTFQWSDNLSWVKGSHTFKFGGDIRRQLFDQTLYYNVNGLSAITAAGRTIRF